MSTLFVCILPQLWYYINRKGTNCMTKNKKFNANNGLFLNEYRKNHSLSRSEIDSKMVLSKLCWFNGLDFVIEKVACC